MNKPVKYYVSYSHAQGFGSLEITLAVPITTHKQIIDIQDFIAKEYKLGLVVILFYTRLENGNIKTVIEEAKQLAEKLNCGVTFEFNGIPMRITADSDTEEKYNEYLADTER